MKEIPVFSIFYVVVVGKKSIFKQGLPGKFTIYVAIMKLLAYNMLASC